MRAFVSQNSGSYVAYELQYCWYNRNYLQLRHSELGLDRISLKVRPVNQGDYQTLPGLRDFAYASKIYTYSILAALPGVARGK